MTPRWLSVLAVAISADVVTAQSPDSTARRLVPVRVTVTREAPRSTLDLPFSVSRLTVDSARTGARRGSLTDVLLTVPGLVASNRHNPTQDPRVAVRGFGARSAFGIRGLRVVRDGVPLTLADGQAAIDFVDLETVASAEVMRGAAGALYGNAGGGVIEFRSEPLPADRTVLSGRTTWNEDAERYSLQAGGRAGEWGWRTTLTRNTADGPRDYAHFRSNGLLADLQRPVGGANLRAQLTWYDSPLAENPGAVTITELGRSPWVADSQNIRRRASKTVGQKLLSVAADRGWDGGNASATLFGGMRELYNPQAFAIVGFDRSALGLSARMQHGTLVRRHLLRVSLGVDLQSQRDDRRNFANCAGLTGSARPAATCPTTLDRGVETIHQLEAVSAAGVFLRGEVTRAAVSVTGAVRGDRTNFTVRERRNTRGTILSRNMGAVSPMLGISWRATSSMSVFANLASSFETPTTTELANQPNGQGGLNRELQPQRGRTLEAGAKGLLGGRVLYDVALFRIATTDELIPFEIPNSGGRRYFRNAGETLRRGAEFGLTASFGAVDVGASVARLRYTYERFTVGSTDLRGKLVPGVASTTGGMFTTVRGALGFATVETQMASRAAADDANANWAPGYALWGVRAGLHGKRLAGLQPVVGVENLFDRTWVGNVVTNATRGRYYEPGSGRRVYVAFSATASRPTATR